MLKQNDNRIHITKLHDIKWNLLSYIFFICLTLFIKKKKIDSILKKKFLKLTEQYFNTLEVRFCIQIREVRLKNCLKKFR